MSNWDRSAFSRSLYLFIRSRNWPLWCYRLVYGGLPPLGAWIAHRRCPLHTDHRYRPVFIVGSGRSGTTLLSRIIRSGPDIHVPPPENVLPLAMARFLRHRDRPWLELVDIIISTFEFHRASGRFEISLTPLAHELKDRPVPERSLAMMIDALFRYHGEQTKQTFTRWGDKTIANVSWLPPLRLTFPDAKFVHVLRDGVDSAVSLYRNGLQPSLEFAAVCWLFRVRAVQSFARRHPASCYEVRYEDLVRDPAATVSDLCRFLDISFSESMLQAPADPREMGSHVPQQAFHANVLNPISPSRIGGGRAELPKHQRAMLDRLLRKDLQRLGYEPVL